MSVSYASVGTVGTTAPGAARRRTGPSAWLAAPAMAFFGLFALVPLVGVVYFSFVNWNGMGPMTWTGLTNWRAVLGDDRTVHAMWLSLVVILVSWLVQAPLSLLLGVFMAGRQRYRAVMAVLYFLPMLFSSAAIGIGFKAMVDPSFGLTSHLGFAWLQQDWLGQKLALWTVLFVVAWTFVPFHSLLYQAGVRQIPAVLYEAAMIDGASGWDQFWRITLPQLKYTIITSSTLMLVGALTYFDLFYVMTQGGPGVATRILPLDMYLTGFRSFEMGKASVIAVILVVVGLTLSITLNKFSGAQRMESQMEGV
ncbi:MAG: sugar ABC transporter permease [Propionibacteriaceae bacterium]|jgi:raffinose/stachyose/melibiose transport system permease protein|nr:sugar ABC transporter permease [Propionibacteriaceae bacterium]